MRQGNSMHKKDLAETSLEFNLFFDTFKKPKKFEIINGKYENEKEFPGSFPLKNIGIVNGIPGNREIEMNRGMPGSFESKNHEMNRGMPGSFESENYKINRGMPGRFKSKNHEMNRGMPGSFKSKNLEMNRRMPGSFESKNHEMNRGMPGRFKSKNHEMNRGMPESFEPKNHEMNRVMPGSFEPKNLEMNRRMPGSFKSKNLEMNRGMLGSFESKNLEMNRGMPGSFEPKNLEMNRGMLGSFESNNLEMNRGMPGSFESKNHKLNRGMPVEALYKEKTRKCSCGLEWGEERISDSNRIIGGMETLDGQYPWLVRIYGGCARQYCTGSLISDRHILTSYHCLKISKTKTPCDHSDGERKALIGTNTFDRKSPNGISLKKYHFPGRAGIDLQDLNSTDLAIYELETPVQFNSSVLPVCLPKNGTEDYTGLEAISAGWGDYRVGKNTNSKVLRSVSLTVAPPIQHHTLFSTITEKNEDGFYKDPCAGDSGGPLMLKNEENKFQIIGTVQGGGYDCDRARLVKTFGDENQKWNKVGIYLDWIQEVLSNSTDTQICS